MDSYILVTAQGESKFVQAPEYREHGVSVRLITETRFMGEIKLIEVERFYPYTAIDYIECREG